MSTFGETIKDLRKEKNATQREMAQALSVTVSTLSHWECDYQEPSFKDLALLAKYFDVSSDYLLGLTDEYEGTGKSAPTAPTALPLDESELLRNYRALSYSGKARAAAYVDLLREQEEGSPSKISYRK